MRVKGHVISRNSGTGRQQTQIQFGTFAKFYFKLSGEKQKVVFSGFWRHFTHILLFDCSHVWNHRYVSKPTAVSNT